MPHQTTPFTYTLLPCPPPQLDFGRWADSLDNRPCCWMRQSHERPIPALIGTPSGPGITGHWSGHRPRRPWARWMPSHTSLDITADGHYHYSFRFSEAGIFEAADGKWTRNRVGSMLSDGHLSSLDGNDRVTVAGGGGVTIWARAQNDGRRPDQNRHLCAPCRCRALEGRSHCLKRQRKGLQRRPSLHGCCGSATIDLTPLTEIVLADSEVSRSH